MTLGEASKINKYLIYVELTILIIFQLEIMINCFGTGIQVTHLIWYVQAMSFWNYSNILVTDG